LDWIKKQWVTQVHPEWHVLLSDALCQMDVNYLKELACTKNWLPGADKLLKAFSLPLSSTRYILLGESPYPRPQSANGYAFWDAAVGSLWSSTGFSREVNRATSLRNLMKMFLFSAGALIDDFSQEAIMQLDQSIYYQTGADLFSGLLNRGFLLLNATLVYEEKRVRYHAKFWRPFIARLLDSLLSHKPSLQLILFGKIAEMIPQYERYPCLVAEHPYNISFITNPNVVNFFKPLNILNNNELNH
jgi:uracil-DNA glycosylase